MEKELLVLYDNARQDFANGVSAASHSQSVDMWHVDEFAAHWATAYPKLAGEGTLFERGTRVIQSSAIRDVIGLRYSDFWDCTSNPISDRFAQAVYAAIVEASNEA